MSSVTFSTPASITPRPLKFDLFSYRGSTEDLAGEFFLLGELRLVATRADLKPGVPRRAHEVPDRVTRRILDERVGIKLGSGLGQTPRGKEYVHDTGGELDFG